MPYLTYTPQSRKIRWEGHVTGLSYTMSYSSPIVVACYSMNSKTSTTQIIDLRHYTSHIRSKYNIRGLPFPRFTRAPFVINLWNQ